MALPENERTEYADAMGRDAGAAQDLSADGCDARSVEVAAKQTFDALELSPLEGVLLSDHGRSRRLRRGLTNAIQKPCIRHHGIVADKSPHFEEWWPITATALVGQRLWGQPKAAGLFSFRVKLSHV